MRSLKLFAIVATVIGAALPATAEAPACLKGDALESAFRQARKDVDARVKEMDFAEAMAPLRAYAIHYWMDRNHTGAKDPLTVWALGGCWSTGCGDPPKGKSESGTPTRFQTLLTYRSQKSKYDAGARPEPPQAPSAFPPGEMLVWAGEQLGCDWSLQGIRQTPGSRVAAAPAKPQVQDDPQWVGYDAARQAGGDQFYQWWRKNFEMRHTSHAFELCRRFGSSSYECGLVAEWTYLNSGKNPYTGGPSQSFNSTYSDYGSNPANAGYKGPKGGSGYNKPVGEPRCYDQGDGTEKCFYD